MSRIAVAAVLLSLAPLMAVPVQAADAPVAAPVAVDPFEDIYAAIQESADMERQLDQLSTTIAQQIASADTSLAIAEARYPGLSQALVTGFRPVLSGYSARVREAFRPRMVAVFRAQLNAGEAHDVAAFYRSPMGKRLLGGVIESFDAKATITSALRDKEVSADAVRADTDAAVRGALAQFTQDDFAALGALAQRQPGLLKLGAIGEALGPIRAEMENQPLTEAEQQALSDAIVTSLDKHIAAATRKPAEK
ncbi:DUF2059 domain-containing protein [Novosphingobium sp.]|uniref:DUF2059 domain-containing protein n=1 Tax=Novosphingobium sp. TaxID=1874826 RepID=UPI0027366B29|nr:DUF2059 domain-containing protein [Novosphingobium sp.]MDP3906516.1 DUF2059 domain-containing protein [Novosphingobium sp.]